jgi:hypothetical protein
MRILRVLGIKSELTRRFGAPLGAQVEPSRILEHDLEKGKPVFRKDHVTTKR